ARRLALPAFQVEPSHFLHRPQTVPEKRIQLVETGGRFCEQVLAVGERPQRLGAFGLRFPVPWAQGIETELFPLPLVDLPYQRNDILPYGLVESETVLFGVIETSQLFELIVPVIGETGV